MKLLGWQPDGTVDLSDANDLLTFLFIGGSPHTLAVPAAEQTGYMPIEGCPDSCR